MNDIKTMATKDTFTVLVGNKSDLKREVTKAEAVALAESYGLEYFETSARENRGVEEPFVKLASLIRAYQRDPERGPKVIDNTVKLTNNNNEPVNKLSSCCNNST